MKGTETMEYILRAEIDRGDECRSLMIHLLAFGNDPIHASAWSLRNDCLQIWDNSLSVTHPRHVITLAAISYVTFLEQDEMPV